MTTCRYRLNYYLAVEIFPRGCTHPQFSEKRQDCQIAWARDKRSERSVWVETVSNLVLSDVREMQPQTNKTSTDEARASRQTEAGISSRLFETSIFPFLSISLNLSYEVVFGRKVQRVILRVIFTKWHNRITASRSPPVARLLVQLQHQEHC